MASPNNFLQRYETLPLAFPFPGWPLAAQQLLTLPPLGKYPHLSPPFGYPYMHLYPYFTMGPLPGQIGQGALSISPGEGHQQPLQGGLRG